MQIDKIIVKHWAVIKYKNQRQTWNIIYFNLRFKLFINKRYQPNKMRLIMHFFNEHFLVKARVKTVGRYTF